MKKTLCLLMGPMLLAVWAATAAAMDTDDPGTAAPMTLEMGLSADYAAFTDGTESALGLSLTTGIIDSLDFGIAIPYLILDPDEGDGHVGIGDMEAGFKWRFLEAEGARPALALTAAVTIPTGDEDKGLGGGDSDVSGALVAGFKFDPVSLYLNVGYNRVGNAATDEGEKEGVVFASAAAEWAVIVTLALNAEFLYEGKGNEGEGDGLAATAGASYTISDMFAVDGGGRVGFTDSAPDWGIFATLTVTLGGK